MTNCNTIEQSRHLQAIDSISMVLLSMSQLYDLPEPLVGIIQELQQHAEFANSISLETQ